MILTEKLSIEEYKKRYPQEINDLESELEVLNFPSRLWCLHCEKWFDTKRLKVQNQEYERPKGKIFQRYFVCPSKGCEGSPVDFFEERWNKKTLTRLVKNDTEEFCEQRKKRKVQFSCKKNFQI